MFESFEVVSRGTSVATVAAPEVSVALIEEGGGKTNVARAKKVKYKVKHLYTI